MCLQSVVDEIVRLRRGERVSHPRDRLRQPKPNPRPRPPELKPRPADDPAADFLTSADAPDTTGPSAPVAATTTAAPETRPAVASSTRPALSPPASASGDRGSSGGSGTLSRPMAVAAPAKAPASKSVFGSVSDPRLCLSYQVWPYSLLRGACVVDWPWQFFRSSEKGEPSAATTGSRLAHRVEFRCMAHTLGFCSCVCVCVMWVCVCVNCRAPGVNSAFDENATVFSGIGDGDL
jgi:hypothetical protein